MGFLSNLFSNNTESATHTKSALTAPVMGAEPAAATAATMPEHPAILCPVAGEAVDLAHVNDPVFSGKAMGDGIAINPANGILTAPVAGTVVALFPTGHALGIRTDDGMEVLLHIGIDTVEMKGEGFQALVAQGERVKQGQALVRFDLDAIERAGYEATTMVIATSAPKNTTMHTRAEGPVADGDTIIWFE